MHLDTACFKIGSSWPLPAPKLQTALENLNSKIILNLVNKVLSHDVQSFGQSNH